MARVIDTASVRVQAETKKAERDAKRSGAKVGKEFADGVDSTSSDAGDALVRGIDGRLRDAKGRFVGAGKDSGDQFRRGFEDGVGRKTIPAPLVEDAEVEMVPIDGPFKARIRALIKEVERNAANIPLTVKGETLRREVAAQVAEIEKTLKGEIPFDPELAVGFRRELELKVKAASLGVGGDVHIGVDVDRGVISRMRELVTVGRLAGSTFTGIGRAGVAAFSQISSTVATFAKESFSKVSEIGGTLFTVLKGIFAIQTLIPAVVTGVALLGGTAVGAFGAIGAGVAGLPVLLTGLIAPIAAVMIGMDGLKTAAVNLKKPFEDVKKGVTDAFANTFRPVFDSLQGVVKALGPGLIGIVTSMSFFAKALADVVNTVDGTRKLETALGGVQLMLDRVRFGAVTVFNAFLNIASTQNLYRILGDTIGGVAERFGNMLERLRSSGDLEKALKQVQFVGLAVVDMLNALIEGSVKFAIGAGPGFKKFLDSITDTLSKIDWTGWGESFGSMMERIGKAIQDVPPETWDQLSRAIGNMADQFIRLMESGAIVTFVEAISAAIGAINGINTAITGIENFLNSIMAIDTGPAIEENLNEPLNKAAADTPGLLDTILASVGEFFVGFGNYFVELGKSVYDFFANLPTTITNGLASLGASIALGMMNAGAAVTEFFANLPANIGYWIGFLATTMALSFMDLVNGVVEIFFGLPMKLGEIAGQAALSVTAWLVTLPATLGAYAQQAYDAVVEWFSQLPGKIALFAADMVMRLLRFFQDLPGQLLDLAGKAVDAIIGEFKEMPGEAKDEAGRTVDNIMESIKELPGKLYQAAKDAVSGFIQGIKDEAYAIYQAAKDAIFGAVQGGRDAIAAHSPSRVFMELGHNTIDGYIIGLRDRLGPARAAMNSIFTSLVGAASSVTQDGIDVGAFNNSALSQSVGAGRQAQLTGETIAAAFAFALQQARLVADGQDLALVMNRVQSLQAVR